MAFQRVSRRRTTSMQLPHSTVYSSVFHRQPRSAYIRSVFSRATPSQRGIRYSSGVYLSLSVTGRSSVETVGRIELLFGTEASFAALCFRQVWATAKLRDGLPSGTFPQTLDLDNIVTARRWSSQRVVESARQHMMHIKRSARSTARREATRRAGPSATADTC